MKIRTDFVTNSSSSNFTIEISVNFGGNMVRIAENPLDHSPDDGGKAKFTGNLEEVNYHLSSVEELATWLTNSIKQDTWLDKETAAFKKKKQRFIEEARTKIKSVRDIDSIVVMRKYDAWGEFAELVGDTLEMGEYAKKYANSSGIDKERAEAEMITHILETIEARGDSFGEDSDRCRYNWHGKSVEALAGRIVKGIGPMSVSGYERKELKLKTGEYFDESYFDLT